MRAPCPGEPSHRLRPVLSGEDEPSRERRDFSSAEAPHRGLIQFCRMLHGWIRPLAISLGSSANHGHDLGLCGSVPALLGDGAILDPEPDPVPVLVKKSPTTFQFAKIEHLIVRG